MRYIGATVGYLVMTLVAVGCGSNGSTASGPSTAGAVDDAGVCKALNVITEIGQMPGDAETLQSMLSNHASRYPGECVSHTPISTWQALENLNQQIAAGAHPDVVEIPADQVPGFLQTQGPNSLYPLDDFLASPSGAEVVASLYPHFLEDAKINGKTLGLPFGGLSMNALYYNRTMFASNHLSPPTTVDELRTVCKTFKAAGIMPVEVFGMGVFLHIPLASVMGIDAFYSYMKGGTPDEGQLRSAIDLFEELGDACIDMSIGEFAINDQVNAFMTGRAAMFISAEWLEATMNQLGWTPGVDYGFAFAPATAGIFTYSLQVLSVMSNTTNLQGALHFLDSGVSAETQDHVPITHVRKYTDKSLLNPERRILVEGMEQAKYHLSANTAAPWEMPAYAFLKSTPRDKEALLQVLLSPAR